MDQSIHRSIYWSIDISIHPSIHPFIINYLSIDRFILGPWHPWGVFNVGLLNGILALNRSFIYSIRWTNFCNAASPKDGVSHLPSTFEVAGLLFLQMVSWHGGQQVGNHRASTKATKEMADWAVAQSHKNGPATLHLAAWKVWHRPNGCPALTSLILGWDLFQSRRYRAVIK